MATSFKERVLKVVREIPKGKTMTYKDVAKFAGSVYVYRAVGNILNKNYNADIPCHRVIRSDRKVGGYNRGRKVKISLLRGEEAI